MADDELFREDLFPEDDDAFFDELPGEESFFPGEEDEFPFGMEEQEQERSGVSRTFKILGGVLLVAVLAVVGLVIALAVNRSGKITDNERTSTAVVATNTAVQVAYQSTVTAQFLMVQATENAVKTQEALATATENAFQTQEAAAATSAAQTATAEFQASQTAAAQATENAILEATQAAADMLLRMVTGKLVGAGDQPFANVTLRLYLDDGDGTFNPPSQPSEAATPQSPASSAATATPQPDAGEPSSSVNTIAYGQTVEDILETGAVDLWSFSGTAGDVLTIDTEAEDSAQTDMFLELVGPGGDTLATDDDSGGNFNASLKEFELPTTGTYVIQVNSVTGPGVYTLTLNRAEAGEEPEPTAEGVSYVPRAGGVDLGGVDLMLQAGDTPEPQPTQPSGDALLTELLTGPDGSFDFGLLEEGTYWIEMDYDTLTPELQALVPPGQPLSFQVQVPTTGEPFNITFGAVPTAVPSPSPEEPSETITPGGPDTPTPSGLETLTPTVEPEITALPESGFFDDMSDSSLDGSDGLMILAAAAAGLVAVVFVARRLRMSS